MRWPGNYKMYKVYKLLRLFENYFMGKTCSNEFTDLSGQFVRSMLLSKVLFHLAHLPPQHGPVRFK